MVSFILNRQFNFKVKDKTHQRFVSFFTVGIIGLAISSFLIYMLVTIMTFNEQVAKLMTIAVVSLIQFILNKKEHSTKGYPFRAKVWKKYSL